MATGLATRAAQANQRQSFRPSFFCTPTGLRFKHVHCRNRTRCRAEGEEGPESLFAKELRRRGIPASSPPPDSTSGPAPSESTADAADASATGSGRSGAYSSSPFSKQATASSPFSTANPVKTDDQLERSRRLQSEGLEGLIPRARELLALGGTFWASFFPLIIAISLLFTALYYGFGDKFVHSGTPSKSPIQYVDPYELLNEAPVDTFYPTR